MLCLISEPLPDSIQNRRGYINYEGDIVVPLIYGAISHFFEGKASVIDVLEKPDLSMSQESS